MTDTQRLTKQILIALIFFLIFGGLGFLLFRTVNPPPPPPTPNPTANLAPISIALTKLLNVQNNDYDFVAKVVNPNTDYGSAEAEYELKFYGAANTIISSKIGNFYILPGQTKYIIDTPLKFSEPISRVELIVKSVDWQKLDPIGVSGVPLIARNVNYQETRQNNLFGRAEGLILNNSDFDLGRVDALVLLFDSGDNLLAVNRTEIRTFLAKTTRGFEVSWFSPFIGRVARVEVEASTNVFENSNFLRQYQQPERFQQFY